MPSPGPDGSPRGQKGFFRGLPLIFPLLAGAHLLMMVFVWWSFWGEWENGGAVQGLWLTAFTACWFGVCMGWKGAVYGYWGLMVTNLILQLFLEPRAVARFADPMNYFDVLFSLVLLIYYKRVLGKL